MDMDSEDSERPDDTSTEDDVEITCPYCGEMVSIRLDPGSGASQRYVEDCQVCCRPWRVDVTYDDSGAVDVQVEPA